jgi:hypothetical protein
VTESRPTVVAPYDRFLEYQDRRRKAAAEAPEHGRASHVETLVVTVPAVPALPQTLDEKQS